MKSQTKRALEECCILVEGYAQVILTNQDAADTDNLNTLSVSGMALRFLMMMLALKVAL